MTRRKGYQGRWREWWQGEEEYAIEGLLATLRKLSRWQEFDRVSAYCPPELRYGYTGSTELSTSKSPGNRQTNTSGSTGNAQAACG